MDLDTKSKDNQVKITFNLPSDVWEKVIKDAVYEEVFLVKLREMVKRYIAEVKETHLKEPKP